MPLDQSYYICALTSIDRFHDLLETVDTGFPVFNDLFGQHVRIRQIVQVRQALS